MFNAKDEYVSATKDARINTYDNRPILMKAWVVNLSLFTVLSIGSYYTYLLFSKDEKNLTAVMGVNHVNISDNDLMTKLYAMEVDTVMVERDNKTISDAMNAIVVESLETSNSKYVEALDMEVANGLKSKTTKMTYEEIISDELKLLN